MAGMGKGPLRVAIEDFIESFDLGKHLGKWWLGGMEAIEKEALSTLNEIVTSSRGGDGISDYINLYLAGKGQPKRPAELIMIIPMIIGLVMGAVSGAMQPFSKLAGYAAEKLAKSFRLDPVSAIRLKFIHNREYKRADAYLADLGVSEATASDIMAVIEPRLAPLDIETLRRKGKLTDDKATQELLQQGWSPSRITQLQDYFDKIPGSGDLIQMAVREAWDPKVVERFQYSVDFPPEFGEWMTKQGYSDYWARKYWTSHWQLPSVTAGYEMLHRLRPGKSKHPFVRDDLLSLLKTADIPVFFRERLIDISYNPFTRVDIRRMFGAGVLDAAEVFDAYQDIGYDVAHATKLTEFTTSIEKAEEKGLTKDVIIASYKRGMISRADALSNLAEIGWKGSDGEFWVNIVDYDIEAAINDVKLSLIQTKYINGILDESSVNDEIGKLNLPSERVTAMLELWTIKRDAKIDIPSKTDLESFYELGFITSGQYSDFLKQSGFRLDVIPWYVKRKDIELAEAASKELERLTKETERVAKLKTATEYQKSVSVIDAAIAELKLRVANIKIALHDLDDDEQAELFKVELLTINRNIAQKNVDKAKLKLTPTPVKQ